MEAEPPKQCDLVVAHFDRVVSLAKRLMEGGTDIHYHEYDPHFFETWQIIAGSYRHRFQFIWNGRNQILTIGEAFFGKLGSLEGDWKRLRELVIDAKNGVDPIQYLVAFFSNRTP